MTNISINKLHEFRDHPYQVLDNEEMNSLIESVQQQGIMTPLIVRPLEDTTDEYEIISGHRRFRAAQKAGLTEVPAFIRPVSRDEAAIMVVDSNLHREHILPSEKAFAYKLKYEALRHQGTSCQLGTKSRTDEMMAEHSDDSARQIQRYNRLTNLIPELLELMNEGKIAFSVGVEFSYLSVNMQYYLLDIIERDDCTPSYSQAFHMHKEMHNGTITMQYVDKLMGTEKPNQRKMLKIPAERVRAFVPKNYTDKLLNYIRFWQADGESEKTSIRTRTSLGQMVEEGHYKGGSAALGYELVKSGRLNKRKHELYDLKINEDDAAIVRLIFDKYTKEGIGIKRLANFLNNGGYANPTGNRWAYNTIRNVLHNPTYTGYLRSGDSRSPFIPELQIISQEQFDRAQEILQQRADVLKNTPRVPLNMKGNALLSGNVFCGQCGARLHLSTANKCYTKADGKKVKKPRIRYVCYGKTRKATQCEGQSAYIQHKLDSTVEGIIREIFNRIKGVPKSAIINSRYKEELTVRKANLKRTQSDYAKELEKLNKLKAEVVKSIQGESAFSQSMLAGLVEDSEKKCESLKAQCERAESEVESSKILIKDQRTIQRDHFLVEPVRQRFY